MIEEQIKPEEKKELTNKEKKKESKKEWWNKIFKDKNKFKKTDKVAVLYLRENGNAEPMDIDVKNGFFNINEKTYHERSDCTYTVGKDRIPLAIIREKSMTPLGKSQWEDRGMQEKYFELQDHLLKGIRHAELVKMGGGEGVSPNLKKWIAGGLGLIILVAILLGAV